MSLQFQPMPLLKRAAPFDDPNWRKYDGFRALTVIENTCFDLQSTASSTRIKATGLGRHDLNIRTRGELLYPEAGNGIVAHIGRITPVERNGCCSGHTVFGHLSDRHLQGIYGGPER